MSKKNKDIKNIVYEEFITKALRHGIADQLLYNLLTNAFIRYLNYKQPKEIMKLF